jgi:hypothetical protein
MKKVIFTQIVLIFVLSVQAQDSSYVVPIRYDSTWVTVSDGYAKFNPFLYCATTSCQPELPYYKLSFLLSPGADLKSVSFRLIDTVSMELPGKYVIRPLPPVCVAESLGNTKCTWPKGITIVDGKDMGIYGTNSFFPTRHVDTMYTGLGWEYKIADIYILPYIYNPVSQKLNALISGKVAVYFETIPNFTLRWGRIPWYEKLMHIDNDTNILHLYELPDGVKSLSKGPLQKSQFKIRYSISTGNAVICYNLPENHHVNVNVFDMKGKLVEKIISGVIPMGRYEVVWDTRRVKPGVYVCKTAINGIEDWSGKIVVGK